MLCICINIHRERETGAFILSFSEEVCLALMNHFMSACLSHDLHVQVHPRDPGPWKCCKTVFRTSARAEPWLVNKAGAVGTTGG